MIGAPMLNLPGNVSLGAPHHTRSSPPSASSQQRQVKHRSELLHRVPPLSCPFYRQMHDNARPLPSKKDTVNVIYSLFYCFEVDFRMAWAPPQPPSEQLKGIRGRLGITTREG